MKDLDVTAFLKKAEELKALFVLGQRVIPFLEEIFLFVKEIKPLLDDINISIEENLAKMPNASKQLSKVTEANELATTEIMDIVDGIVYKADLITNNVNSLTDLKNKQLARPLQILDIVQKAINNENQISSLLPKLNKVIEDIKTTELNEYDEVSQKSNELLGSIQDDSNSIMMSLQVQDITSQQIAAVNHLLLTIQDKLGAILQKFQNSGIQDIVQESNYKYSERTNVSQMHRSIAFDPEAVEAYDLRESRQSQIDDMFTDKDKVLEEAEKEKAETQVSNDSEPAPDIAAEPSNDDIDALFAGSEKEEASADDIDALFAGSEKEEASADDIDALFGNGNVQEEPEPEPEKAEEVDMTEPFSQDDIDAMFGK